MAQTQGRTKALPPPPAADASLIDWALWHFDHGKAIKGYRPTPIQPGEKAAYQKSGGNNE